MFLTAVSASSGELARTMTRRNSVHALLALSPLDFFKSVSDGESTLLLDGHTFDAGLAAPPGDPSLQAAIAAEAGSHRPSFDASHRSFGRDPSTTNRSRLGTPSRWENSSSVHAVPLMHDDGVDGIASPTWGSAAEAESSGPAERIVKAPTCSAQAPASRDDKAVQREVGHHRVPGHSLPLSRSDGDISGGISGDSSSSVSLYSATSAPQEPQPAKSAMNVMRSMWPCQLSLFISGSTTLAVFPLVTYVPTSGALGTLLPKWLFFVRLFADLAGRLLPRMQLLAVQHPGRVLMQALLLISLTPLFYLYIIFAPAWFLSDTVACVYIAVIFLLNGMINTNVYVLVPKLVKLEDKALAAGLLAVTYQGAHVIGLLAGAALCLTILS